MRSSIKKVPQKAAFLPVGFGLIAVGQPDNLAFMGAGIVFVIIGAVAIREHRNS